MCGKCLTEGRLRSDPSTAAIGTCPLTYTPVLYSIWWKQCVYVNHIRNVNDVDTKGGSGYYSYCKSTNATTYRKGIVLLIPDLSHMMIDYSYMMKYYSSKGYDVWLLNAPIAQSTDTSMISEYAHHLHSLIDLIKLSIQMQIQPKVRCKRSDSKIGSDKIHVIAVGAVGCLMPLSLTTTALNNEYIDCITKIYLYNSSLANDNSNNDSSTSSSISIGKEKDSTLYTVNICSYCINISNSFLITNIDAIRYVSSCVVGLYNTIYRSLSCIYDSTYAFIPHCQLLSVHYDSNSGNAATLSMELNRKRNQILADADTRVLNYHTIDDILSLVGKVNSKNSQHNVCYIQPSSRLCNTYVSKLIAANSSTCELVLTGDMDTPTLPTVSVMEKILGDMIG